MKWRNELAVVIFFICKESSSEVNIFSSNFILYKNKCPILIGCSVYNCYFCQHTVIIRDMNFVRASDKVVTKRDRCTDMTAYFLFFLYSFIFLLSFFKETKLNECLLMLDI
jgi:hypothetical protein